MTKLSQMEPGFPLARAQALMAEHRGREAVDILGHLVESGRAGLLARVLYARALIVTGDTVQAVGIARETVFMFPAAAAAATSLGEALLSSGLLPAAIAELQRALRIDPASAEARYALGRAWLEAGEPENALREFSTLHLEEIGSELTEKIEQAERMRGAPRSNANYVRHLFDQFSTDYDMRMETQLGYGAPAILRSLFSMISPSVAQHSLRVLDLGCGTGLAGARFADMARTLDGIDLSPAMLAKARERNIYSTLHCGDIESLAAAEPYDLVIAADTLVYLGDLHTVLSRVRQALSSRGTFLFTVEAKEGEGYELGPKRRWRHSAPYLREQATEQSFKVSALLECSPRMEAGTAVPGLATALIPAAKAEAVAGNQPDAS